MYFQNIKNTTAVSKLNGLIELLNCVFFKHVMNKEFYTHVQLPLDDGVENHPWQHTSNWHVCGLLWYGHHNVNHCHQVRGQTRLSRSTHIV